MARGVGTATAMLLMSVLMKLIQRVTLPARAHRCARHVRHAPLVYSTILMLLTTLLSGLAPRFGDPPSLVPSAEAGGAALRLSPLDAPQRAGMGRSPSRSSFS